MATQPADSRPLSPHLQVWRWHATMASSILHRFTGVANYAWVSALAGWIIYAAWSGDAAFSALFSGWSAPIAYLLVFGALISVSYHFFNGIRHLVWDAGFGFEPGTASLISTLNIVAGLIVGGAAFAWFFLAMGGL